MRYDVLAQEALRHVVRGALQKVAAEGLPGDHHFFITFRTTAPGVVLAERLREQYPGDMTVVIKTHFWDLNVGPESFEVTLRFQGQPDRLSIPFAAISGFFDPAVSFGLQFPVADEPPPPEPEVETEPEVEEEGAAQVVQLDAFRKK